VKVGGGIEKSSEAFDCRGKQHPTVATFGPRSLLSQFLKDVCLVCLWKMGIVSPAWGHSFGS
jgi:hypothetical protein